MRGADADPAEVDQLLYGFAGELAFDVGGNVGRTAKILAGRFEYVVSFEPCDESYRELASLGLPNVEALQVAVSDHDGAVNLDVQEHPITTGQLTTGGYEGWGRVIGHREVPCRTVDSLAAEYGPPDLVKVDVEAHELHVIRGGLATLAEHKPDLYIEVHRAEIGAELRELLTQIYGVRLREIRHPHYRPGQWGAANHYWLVAE